MGLKRFFFALLISGTVLFIEFKIAPFILRRVNFFKQKVNSPILKVEELKFNLSSALKEGNIPVWQGPFAREEIRGIEVVIIKEKIPLKILFSLNREPRSQLASLQLILNEAKIVKALKERVPPKLIDLTGDKPYVSF